jgi:polyferredoxin
MPLGLDVIRDRNQLYRETRGLIENIYTLKVLNMDDKAHAYRLSVSGIDGITIDSDQDTIYVEAGNVQDFPIRLRADESNLQNRSNEINLSLVAIDNEELSVVEHARFLGPIP